MANIYHYWVSTREGYVMSTLKKLPVSKPMSRYKYIGFSSDMGWPKKMNTGRLFHQASKESEIKKRKYTKKARLAAKKLIPKF